MVRHLLKSDAGFSLLELLVAVAVLSLAAMTLLENQAGGMRMTGQVQTQTLAAIVAENRLALLRTQMVAPKPGSNSGNEVQLGQTYRWREDVKLVQGSGLLSLDVTVLGAGGDIELAHLTGFRKAD
jgi:general secretion pathway protein I